MFVVNKSIILVRDKYIWVFRTDQFFFLPINMEQYIERSMKLEIWIFKKWGRMYIRYYEEKYWSRYWDASCSIRFPTCFLSQAVGEVSVRGYVVNVCLRTEVADRGSGGGRPHFLLSPLLTHTSSFDIIISLGSSLLLLLPPLFVHPTSCALPRTNLISYCVH